MRVDLDGLWEKISQSWAERPYDAMADQLVNHALMVPTGAITLEGSRAYLASEDWQRVRYRLSPKLAVTFAASGNAINFTIVLKKESSTP